MVMDLLAPLVFDEDTGKSERDERYGLITREQAKRLLDLS